MNPDKRELALRCMPTLFELDFLTGKYIEKYGEDIGDQPLDSPFLGFYMAISGLDTEMSFRFVELLESYRSSGNYYQATLAEAILEDRLDKIKSIMAVLD